MKTATLLAMLLLATQAVAGKADVLEGKASCDARRRCSFEVTVRHDDAGWPHYADKWDILTPDGRLLGTRVLLHPHDTEQPFTRSLGGVAIPRSVRSVRIRAHDKLHGYGGAEIAVELP